MERPRWLRLPHARRSSQSGPIALDQFGGLTSKQRKRAEKLKRRSEMRSRRMTRRNFILVAGSAAVAAVAAGGYFALQSRRSGDAEPNTAEDFVGDNASTGQFISQWEKEVGRDLHKLLAYEPRIKMLATAFFEKQTVVDKQSIRSRLLFLPETEYDKKAEECGAVARGSKSFLDIIHNAVYININRQLHTQFPVAETFFDFVVRSYHLSSNWKHVPLGFRLRGTPEPVEYQKGLIVMMRNNLGNSNHCWDYNTHNAAIQKAVVKHSGVFACTNARVIGNPEAFGDIADAVLYHTLIVHPLYDGESSELFRFQQSGKNDEFFDSITERLKKTGSSERGEDYVEKYFTKTPNPLPPNIF